MGDPTDDATGLIRAGAAFEAAGLAPAASGNLSIRREDDIVITPTGSRLGALNSAALAVLDGDGFARAGQPPSKEWPLHLALYRARPDAQAIVHLHAPASVAVSCLATLDERDAIPAYTAYRVMRIGRLPLVPYLPPGDPSLGDAAAERATDAGRGLLLANHGLVAWGRDLDEAGAVAEEIEAASELRLRLDGRPVRLLTDDERAELERRYR